jgi:hypothetical protein
MMIIPTPAFDPMFADDGVPFRDKMLAYIRREFSDLLGPRIHLESTGAPEAADLDRLRDVGRIAEKAA